MSVWSPGMEEANLLLMSGIIHSNTHTMMEQPKRAIWGSVRTGIETTGGA